MRGVQTERITEDQVCAACTSERERWELSGLKHHLETADWGPDWDRLSRTLEASVSRLRRQHATCSDYYPIKVP